MTEEIIKAFDLLSTEDKLKVLEHIKKTINSDESEEYILLNVGYSNRIAGDDDLNQIYMHMFEVADSSFRILAIGGYLGSVPRFDCSTDDNFVEEIDGVRKYKFEEHPMVRNLWTAKSQSSISYWDGVLFTSETPHDNIFQLLKCIKEFEHCGSLESPYDSRREQLLVNGKNVNITIYEFDTESG